MRKITKAAIATPIAVAALLIPNSAQAAGTYVRNDPASQGALYSYSGTGCTGTVTYYAAGQSRVINAKSYKTHFTTSYRLDGSRTLIRARNVCLTTNVGSLNALVNVV